MINDDVTNINSDLSKDPKSDFDALSDEISDKSDNLIKETSEDLEKLKKDVDLLEKDWDKTEVELNEIEREGLDKISALEDSIVDENYKADVADLIDDQMEEAVEGDDFDTYLKDVGESEPGEVEIKVEKK